MSTVPTGMVEVAPIGVVRVLGSSLAMPVYMLMDEQERNMAVPLTRLESDLLQHTLDGNIDLQQAPQPHRALISCLEKMSAALDAVYIHYSSELDMPTRLVLRSRGGNSFQVDVPVSDGIIFARLTGSPIFVDEELMSAIGARKETNGRGPAGG